MKLDCVLQRKRDVILEIAKEHGALVVVFLALLPVGKELPHSDIDLIVEMEPDRSLLYVIAIKLQIEDALQRKVDIVTEAALSPYIRNEILHEAVVL